MSRANRCQRPCQTNRGPTGPTGPCCTGPTGSTGSTGATGPCCTGPTGSTGPNLPEFSARVTREAPLTIVDGAVVSIPFPIERFDNGGLHDLVVNPERLTVPAGGAGRYQITAAVSWAGNPNGYRDMQLLLNGGTPGATIIAIDTDEAVTAIVLGEVIPTRQSITTLWNLADGDYVEVQVQQNSGTPFPGLAILKVEAFSPEFMMIRVGP